MSSDQNLNSINFITNYYDGKLPDQISEDGKIKLIILAQAGDLEAQNKLLLSMLKFISNISMKAWKPGAEADDLFQIGVIGCIKAIQTFNIDFGYVFSTYCGKVIKNEINLYYRKFKYDKLLVSIDDIIYINKDGSKISLLDTIEDPDIDVDPEKAADILAIKDIINESLDVLNLTEREIIERRFELNGKTRIRGTKNLEDHYHISHVSYHRYLNKALLKLKYHIMGIY